MADNALGIDLNKPKPKQSLSSLLGIDTRPTAEKVTQNTKSQTAPKTEMRNLTHHIKQGGQERRPLAGQSGGNQYVGKEGNPQEKHYVEALRHLETMIHDADEKGQDVSSLRKMHDAINVDLENVRKGVKSVPHTEKSRNLLPSEGEKSSKELTEYNTPENKFKRAVESPSSLNTSPEAEDKTRGGLIGHLGSLASDIGNEGKVALGGAASLPTPGEMASKATDVIGQKALGEKPGWYTEDPEKEGMRHTTEGVTNVAAFLPTLGRGAASGIAGKALSALGTYEGGQYAASVANKAANEGVGKAVGGELGGLKDQVTGLFDPNRSLLDKIVSGVGIATLGHGIHHGLQSLGELVRGRGKAGAPEDQPETAPSEIQNPASSGGNDFSEALNKFDPEKIKAMGGMPQIIKGDNGLQIKPQKGIPTYHETGIKPVSLRKNPDVHGRAFSRGGHPVEEVPIPRESNPNMTRGGLKGKPKTMTPEDEIRAAGGTPLQEAKPPQIEAKSGESGVPSLARRRPIKVYEDENGRHIIDGEKRTDAAIAAGDTVDATVIKKSDGVSPETAKALGITQNILDGTANPEDVAHLGDPERNHPSVEGSGGPQATPRGDSEQKPVQPTDVKNGTTPPQEKSSPAEPSENTTGISQKINEAQAGTFGEVKPGKGENPPDLVQKGQDALKNGADPKAALGKFRENPTQNADLAGIIRAHELELHQKYVNSVGTPEEAAAKKAVGDWRKEIKPLATDLSNAFKTYQGETEVDTGNWKSLAAHHMRNSKETVSPKVEQEAKTRASSVGKAKADTSAAEAKSSEGVKSAAEKAPKPKTPKTLKDFATTIKRRIDDGSLFRDLPASKQAGGVSPVKSPKFTPEERAQLWNIFKKEYLDPAYKSGKSIPLTDLARRVTADFAKHGVTFPEDWVRDIVAGRKSPLREIDRATLEKRFQLRQVQREARFWAKQGPNGATAYQKLSRGIGVAYNTPRAVLTFGHGIVWPATHAGSAGLDPAVMGHNMQGYFNAIKLLKKSNLEDMYEHMEAKDNYPLKVQSGLRIQPESEDDWQHYHEMLTGGKGILKPISKAAEAGQRQMEGLKFWRDGMFDQLWDAAPSRLKGSPEDRMALAKDISRQVNHMSGTTHPDEGFGPKYEGAWRTMMFGPNLFRARLYKVIGDPVKTAKTFANWNAATPSEQYIAKYRLMHGLRASSTYITALAANYALIKSLHKSDKDNVNWDNPRKPDWMMLKSPFGGTSFDVTGNALGIAKTGVNMAQDLRFGGQHGGDKVQSAAGEGVKKLLGGVNPALQLGLDVARQKDFQGRPYPFAPQDVKRKAEAKGIKPLGYPETFFGTVAPIPSQDLAKDVFEELHGHQHLDATFARKLSEAIVSGLSGVREVPKDTKPKIGAARVEPKNSSLRALLSR